MISHLSFREKIALAAAALVIVLTIVWLGIYDPYRNSLVRLDKRIESRSRQLEQVQDLSVQYQKLQEKLARAERGLLGRNGTSLFSNLETIIAQVGIREKLSSLRPQKNAPQGEYLEESAELKLERIYLDELIRLLYAMETADIYLQIKNLRIKPRFEDSDLLDASMQIASYRRDS